MKNEEGVRVKIDTKKYLNWIKKIILILSIYFVWLVIIDGNDYGDPELFSPIPFTIITVYVWNKFIAKNK
jgi:hypothetical protein